MPALDDSSRDNPLLNLWIAPKHVERYCKTQRRTRSRRRSSEFLGRAKITRLDSFSQGNTDRLTRRAALTVVFALSLGLWATIWAAVAFLASAVFG
jgi:hypothetical protein